jgi:hypothetical protein
VVAGSVGLSCNGLSVMVLNFDDPTQRCGNQGWAL